ncbi:MAG: 30S ribosomal protein S2 [Candidatus Nanoarchaeia archaeon]|nr:30S ribosomal protein S2 [Candidatus Nanoarchaeia archaeon]
MTVRKEEQTKIEEEQNAENLLVPLDQYLKVGLHIGTKYKTKYMEPFIYKTRQDGLAVLNVQKINDRISVATKFLSQYNPDEILIVCRRENGHRAVKMCAKLTGMKVYVGRYPPGVLTNPSLENFHEAKILIVSDPWVDKNAIKDAVTTGAPIIGLCDTNNEANNLDLIVPCNNKGRKSLALFYYILAKEFLKNKGIIKDDKEFSAQLEDFYVEE